MPISPIMRSYWRSFSILFPKWFARALGVGAKRKVTLYMDLSEAATLGNLIYWLQIIFGAGIATLGLVMNSPAVIIGAMLISPLMNPILSTGLALASGDIVLGVRAAISLSLSCAAAVVFAILLVVLLPFREMTTEIAARTQPNFLDLLIALFSGAVGSVALCHEVKGVVTSIPGVAISVALMPPLCVVGYGIGLVLVLDPEQGWRVASGGGLLFLTNLVAITLTAMLVFVTLRIETPAVRKKIEEWQMTNTESRFVMAVMHRFPGLERASRIHSLRLRLSMIAVPLILILIPLSSALVSLKTEIDNKRRESRIRLAVTDVWQDDFQKASDGTIRSSIDNLTISESGGKLNVNLRVFDDRPYTVAEKQEFVRVIAERLARPPETLNLTLIEIPTVSALNAFEQARQTARAEPAVAAKVPQDLSGRAEMALTDLEIPPPGRILRKRIVTSDPDSLEITVVYLSDERLSPEAENDVTELIRGRLNLKTVGVFFERIAPEIGAVGFGRNGDVLTVSGMMSLDFVGRVMRENPDLRLAISAAPVNGKRLEIKEQRDRSITEYLESRWQIAQSRIQIAEDGTLRPGENRLNFLVQESGPTAEPPSEP